MSISKVIDVYKTSFNMLFISIEILNHQKIINKLRCENILKSRNKIVARNSHNHKTSVIFILFLRKKKKKRKIAMFLNSDRSVNRRGGRFAVRPVRPVQPAGSKVHCFFFFFFLVLSTKQVSFYT